MANQATMKYGQMARPNIARDGAAKRLTVPALANGMKRATTGGLHPYLHGQCVDDSAPDKTYEAPLHPATRKA